MYFRCSHGILAPQLEWQRRTFVSWSAEFIKYLGCFTVIDQSNNCHYWADFDWTLKGKWEALWRFSQNMIVFAYQSINASIGIAQYPSERFCCCNGNKKWIIIASSIKNISASITHVQSNALIPYELTITTLSLCTEFTLRRGYFVLFFCFITVLNTYVLHSNYNLYDPSRR